METRDAQINCHDGQAEPFSGHVEQRGPQLFGGLVYRPRHGCGEGGLDPERSRR
ncbi:hypothetical protein [Streptomyces sp. NPDC013457]|uniref:hypothetical protein n=1 Tax=Streptomyces sp. NPDC013457 TaxID=3364866 RepID=UPI0037030EC4